MVTKNTKKTACLIVFFLVLGTSSLAYGATEDTRYLVKSHSGFWKKSFGIRHEFKDGFTANLTDWQLKIAKVFGLEVVPVKKLDILPDSVVISTDDNSTIEGVKIKPTPSVPVRPVPTSRLPWGVRAIYGDNPTLASTSGGFGINVAVLDTGVIRTHPDLIRRITDANCKDFTSAKQPVVDNQCDDKNGHGTHVAGIIAADGGADNKGIYGVVPGANIFAYKVCGNNGSCWSDDIAFAIETAVKNGANIISMSLGSDTESSLITDAVSGAVAKDVLIIAAAGNDGPDIGTVDYPAANPEVVAVGAFDKDLIIPTWSSRGKNSLTDPKIINEGDIEFAAPGVVIESTYKDGGYIIMSGTSMATPHVAGLAAKLWQKDAIATRDILKKFVQDLPPGGEDNDSGYGFPHL